MNRLFTALGVDYIQWRALMRAYTWMDYAALFGAYGPAHAVQAVRQFVVMVSLLLAVGLIAALCVWAARDLFLAANIVVSMALLWTLLLVAAQPASIASPDDLAVVGFRPVSSRTYFAVRFTSLLTMVLETAALFGIIPVIAFITRRDGSILLGIAAVAALMGVSLAVTSGAVAIYGWLIRIVPPHRLARAMGYAGAALSLVGTIVMFVTLHRVMDTDNPFAFLDATLPRDMRTMWFPGAWFASYVPLAAGEAVGLERGAALASVALLLLFGAFLRGRMSLDYAKRIADVAARSDAGGARGGRQWYWLRDETRAIALLIAAHLRGDMKVQLGVVSAVVMGVMIAAGSTGFRMPGDPFIPGRGGGDAVMPLLALVMVPLQLYQNLAIAHVEGVWWVYFATPADRTRLVRATRDALAAFVLLPLLLLFALFFAYAFGHVRHAALHTLFLGLLSYLSLQISILITPKLPFSALLTNNRGNPFSIGAMLAVMFTALPLGLAIQVLAYPTVAGRVAALALLLGLSWWLDVLMRRRVNDAGVLAF